jgi:hypothetical protein
MHSQYFQSALTYNFRYNQPRLMFLSSAGYLEGLIIAATTACSID